MNDEEYMKSRVDDQIDWYGKKSKHAQFRFKLLRGSEIVAAASIPLVAGFATETKLTMFVIGAIGASITVMSALISLNQLQEKWTEYRTTCESLKHEKYLYLGKAEPYHDEEPFALLVQRVESLISKENSAWLKYTRDHLENTKRRGSNENQKSHHSTGES